MVRNLEKIYLENGSVVYHGEISKSKGEFLEKKRSFHIRPLTEKNCSAMEDLSVCIYDNLEKGQECFIHRHDRKYYKEIFANPDCDVKFVGVFLGRELIAMSNLKLVDTYENLQEEFPNHKLKIFSKDRNIDEVKVAVLGSDSVHPKYRGNSLNQTMIEYRIEHAQQHGATDVVSIIDRKNVWNMTPYFENGFHMFGSSVDPADDGKIALMHRPLKETVEKVSEPHKAHFENFSQIDKMFHMKRVGVGYDKEQQRIVFAQTDYYDNLKKMDSQNSQKINFIARKYVNASRL